MPSPDPTPPSPDSAARPCPRCGQPIPTGAAHGLCPACLLAAGFFTQAAPGEPITPDSPPPSPAELAAEFPALEIVELLGQGGMGAVYKARQRHLDRLVALKLLRPGLDVDPTFADRFTREARALAQLNHPGIVTLHEFGSTPGGRFFILMEFVDGVNLRQLLAAGRLSPREALAIIPPLCDALQYAHDRGLVHRDIKPENILVDRLGRVKIADFGLAKLAAPSGSDLSVFVSHSTASGSPASGDLTEAGKILGTPRYMAPEQREHPAAVDHRSDIYALGVVLYQMLTGELPDEKHLQPPSHRVQIDVRLDEIVLRALEKNPALRYAAASEFKTRLETVADAAYAAEPAPAPTPAPIITAPASPSAFPPWLGFIVLYLGHLSLLIVTAKDLPLRVASHFNGDGRANGWMPRGDYLLFSAVFPLALGLFLALLAWSLRVLPASLINLPHRDHWLAPENKAATATLFARWMAAPACLLVVFFSQLGWLVARANLSATPRLPGGPMIGITIGFLAALMIWLVGLVLRFAEPKATRAKLRRQHAILFVAALLALAVPAAPLINESHNRPGKFRRQHTDPEPASETFVAPPSIPSSSAREIQAEVRFLLLPRDHPFDPTRLDTDDLTRIPGADVLSAPRVTVRSGSDCEIIVAHEIIHASPADQRFQATPPGVSVRLRPTLAYGNIDFDALFTITTPDPATPGLVTTKELKLLHRSCALDTTVTPDFGLDAQGRRQIALLRFSLVAPPSASSPAP